MWPFSGKPKYSVYECVLVNQSNGERSIILVYINDKESDLTPSKCPWLKNCAISSAKPISKAQELARAETGWCSYNYCFIKKAAGSLVINYRDFKRITELRF
jgi:hypothetical protein